MKTLWIDLIDTLKWSVVFVITLAVLTGILALLKYYFVTSSHAIGVGGSIGILFFIVYYSVRRARKLNA